MIQTNEAICSKCGNCVRTCPMGFLKLTQNGPIERINRRCIECGHCTAACPKNAIKLVSERGPLQVPQSESPLEIQVLQRRSIRHFRPDAPDRALIQHVLDLAEYSPNGKNIREHQWTVVYGIEETQKVTDMALDFSARTGEAIELLKIKAAGTNLLTCDAPCVIIAWSPNSALNPVVDPVIAMTQVEMLLNERGVSTCWGGYLKQIADADTELQEYLGIPADCMIRCALMVGYAQGEHYFSIPARPAAKITWLESSCQEV